LEGNKNRGVYAGSLGYICASGTVDQSVVIRTIVKRGNSLELGAGGAITWLSESDKEWDEVMVKANAVAKALPLLNTESLSFDTYASLEQSAIKKDIISVRIPVPVDPVH
jgi:anthranilate/para-aminobenzoate synthase component I